MSDQKNHQEGSCCQSGKSSGGCCGAKKLFVGIVAGILIAMAAHCFLCSKGGHCGANKAMCPLTSSQSTAVPTK